MTAEQLYIDPSTCIDCGACARACPADAIYPASDLPSHLQDFEDINSDYFADFPLTAAGPPPIDRRWVPDTDVVRVAIVGSGPSGMYVAEALSEIANVSVTIIERLPVPYGLLRSGIAPDHHRTKRVSDRFDRVLARSNVTCYFNTEVGRDVSADDLSQHHHAVVWAIGTPDGRRLNLPGAQLQGVTSAREVTAWYNGHPDYALEGPNLDGDRAVIVGNGNVALDVARLLTLPPDRLATSTISAHALEALRASAIREVVVIGRRGPSEAAYGTAELLELSRLPGVDLLADSNDIAAWGPDATQDRRAPSASIAGRRRAVVETAARRVASSPRRIVLRYGLTPVRFRGDETLTGVELAAVDGSTEFLQASLVVTAIGFTGTPVERLPFDEIRGILPNDAGRVVDGQSGQIVTGLYCVGWVKRGPSGTLGTNRWDAASTVDAIVEDLREERLSTPAGDADGFARLVASRQPQVVSAAGWVKIDAIERDAGREVGRPRIPMVTVDEMVKAAHRRPE